MAYGLADALDRHLGPGASASRRSEHALSDADQLRGLVDGTLRRVHDYGAFDLEFVEQPVRGPDLAGMAFVRERTSIPIMTDESVWDSVDAIAVVRTEAADLVNIYVMEAGGLREARQALAVC